MKYDIKRVKIYNRFKADTTRGNNNYKFPFITRTFEDKISMRKYQKIPTLRL